MRVRALAMSVFVALAVVGLTTAPALAGTGRSNSDSSGRISVDGGLFIGPDEHIEGLVVAIDGDVRIEGDVNDDVYVVAGDVRITGRVHEDVLVIGGDARIIGGQVDGDVVAVGGRAVVKGEGAVVDGDVRSSDKPFVREGGRVRGDTKDLGVTGLFGTSLMFSVLAFLWLAVTVSGALLGLLFVWLFPGAADASVRAGRDPARSIPLGLAVGILGPIVAILIGITLVGLPLGLGLGAALFALFGLGYVASALTLGRTMVKGETTGARIGAFFAGFGILRAAAIVPGLGALVSFMATVYGVGILVNAAWRASRGRTTGSDEPPVGPTSDDTNDVTPPPDTTTADEPKEEAPVSFKADAADESDATESS